MPVGLGFAFGRAWAGAHWQPTEIPAAASGEGGAAAGPGQAKCAEAAREIQDHGSHEAAWAASEVSSHLPVARRGTSRQGCRGAGARGTPRGRNRATGRGNLE